MKQKLLSLLLALSLLLTLAPAALAYDDDGFQIEDGVLISYIGPDGDVVVPRGVTAIGDGAFLGTSPSSVTLPDGVVSIGEDAFLGCMELSSVTIPASVTYIGSNAFVDTPWLAAQGAFPVVNGILLAYQGESSLVEVPLSVTAIAPRAFYGRTDVTAVYLPGSVAVLGAGAFQGCVSLEAVTLPAGLRVVSNSAFDSCRSLSRVILPDGVTTVEDWAFFGCTALEVLYIPASVTTIGSQVLTGCANVTVYGDAGSAAQRYAEANYLSFQPTPAPAPQNWLAYASTQYVELDSQLIQFQMYALKDVYGSPTNYIRLRDLAKLLSGTSAQFDVQWDGSVNLLPGRAYTPNGSELSTPFSGDRTYTVPTSRTRINSVVTNLEAITLYDDYGGGFTYYKLRDLGKLLGFNVGWDANRGIAYVQTDQPYVG